MPLKNVKKNMYMIRRGILHEALWKSCVIKSTTRIILKENLPYCPRRDSDLSSSNLFRNCESSRVNNFYSATIELSWFHFRELEGEWIRCLSIWTDNISRIIRGRNLWNSGQLDVRNRKVLIFLYLLGRYKVDEMEYEQMQRCP